MHQNLSIHKESILLCYGGGDKRTHISSYARGAKIPRYLDEQAGGGAHAQVRGCIDIHTHAYQRTYLSTSTTTSMCAPPLGWTSLQGHPPNTLLPIVGGTRPQNGKVVVPTILARVVVPHLETIGVNVLTSPAFNNKLLVNFGVNSLSLSVLIL